MRLAVWDNEGSPRQVTAEPLALTERVPSTTGGVGGDARPESCHRSRLSQMTRLGYGPAHSADSSFLLRGWSTRVAGRPGGLARVLHKTQGPPLQDEVGVLSCVGGDVGSRPSTTSGRSYIECCSTRAGEALVR